VWIAGAANPNHYVDITATFGRKLAALRAHESQHRHPSELEGWLRQWLGRTAEAAGFPEGSLAESFQIVDTA
jgi:LmbE family N-acetylglucosaminyl deacetylase